MNANEILFENEQFLIADKAHGIPTVPLKTQNLEGTLLGVVSKKCSCVLDVCGKNSWEGGAVHRLDTDTAGLVLFAKTQQFYDYIQNVQMNNKFVKKYIALCDEQRPIDDSVIKTYFRAFGPGHKLVKPVQDKNKADSEVLYSTSVKRLEKGKYICEITRGFRHQIRVVLASNNCPIVGDKLYNPNHGIGNMQLMCVGMNFPMPDGSIFEYTLQ